MSQSSISHLKITGTTWIERLNIDFHEIRGPE